MNTILDMTKNTMIYVNVTLLNATILSQLTFRGMMPGVDKYVDSIRCNGIMCQRYAVLFKMRSIIML